MLPASWKSVAARACRTSPSARRMAAAAAATVGFFSCARRIASSNVTRIAGAGGPCAPAIAAHTLNATPAAQALDDDIQPWNERKVQERRRDHAAGHRGADRVPRLAPGAAREDERHHAEDERERRHEDRPQPEPGRLDGGLGDRQPARAQLLGELDD